MKHPIIMKIRADIRNGEGFVEPTKEFIELMRSDSLTALDILSDVIFELQGDHKTAFEDFCISYKIRKRADGKA